MNNEDRIAQVGELVENWKTTEGWDKLLVGTAEDLKLADISFRALATRTLELAIEVLEFRVVRLLNSRTENAEANMTVISGVQMAISDLRRLQVTK